MGLCKTYLSVSGLFHLAQCPSGFPSLKKVNDIPLHVYTTFCSSVHHLLMWTFRLFLCLCNNAAMNTGVQISPQDPHFTSFGWIPSGVFQNHRVVLILIF